MKPGCYSGLRKPLPKELNLRLIFTLRPDFSEVCPQLFGSMVSIKRAGSTNSTAVRDALAQTKDFAGVLGDITIDAKRNALKNLGDLRALGVSLSSAEAL